MARTTVSNSNKIGPEERAAAIQALKSRELDVLVIGGGIVGTGSALDAVTRGLSVGIVEARDWGSGTSSRSSKLVHGGIRYLEQLNFALVREALIERGLLLQRLAPHLVKPVKFLYPLNHRVWERFYIGIGMAMYDAFSWSGGRPPGVPHHRHLSKRQVMRAIPSLAKDALVGGMTYYDAQVDDARYVASLARTAAAYGAHAASRVRIEGFVKVGERVVGAKAHDIQTGERFDIRAKQVVNATGVWTDDTQAMVGERGQFKVRASKGVHLVIPRDRFQSTMGMILRTEKSVLFVIPWGRHWLVGTTDTDWDLDKAHPAATAADIDYILEHVNQVLAVPLTREDVEGVYAGLRPLLAGESDQTSKLSREHIVAHTVPGLVVVAGGKWTTYRVMAKDAIDEAVAALDGRIPESITDEIPLLGAEGYPAAWNRRGRTARAYGLHKVRLEHLLNRYGTLADEVLRLVSEDPTLAEPLPGADDYIGAEVVYAASHESALHLEDVLARRTRISIEAWDRGESAAPVAARLMAGVLGWDRERTEEEVGNYLKRVAAERASQLEPDDASADRVRLEAPDIAFGFEEDDVKVGGPGRQDGGRAEDEQVIGEKTTEPR
ncbi:MULTISPECIES: glycerol-3-phosphate dehydrogenase/oxidase [unclassified Curtobacterium]|uniref:glycerol-3-phosphate dehydrogenase/oxidase n=1 Tax=unclassified Curtobacterium TaxID=257496 RepID=UPI000DA7E953|nr:MULTISPECIES: glycerol-3-phosphate dehydrogenase/oxidase [unclassified Curtobacterium]PZE28058.1 glycerol-3-phosphate dehydrogenase [Curtobacterium sp. MCBD17_028]PZE72060.1 glycerol-3-phosphate dehydrogenase [Curtobacterium sp. MCBD17_019]PZF62327.1 glycerol-3-phosphate dehydrogenase [Curtobacterium sp. MCBD17_034]PZF63797.1 glycerol-3-phosphate dehydrogenase [Curtobacterium sp. MCBD17_013]PZM39966.1 glycerol-3-phosphate dehydrogenase [Curtobacterium sp. MCBD17_031]